MSPNGFLKELSRRHSLCMSVYSLLLCRNRRHYPGLGNKGESTWQ
ncbi:hypothetical protein HMPREF0322_00219 [Desulfitobacterium hafniense DP7]|uniref:Uncharacterized protein n=1 Tax=Desulfitobacterium hafniense DP7 TaxID=537010 RepID=G9XGZ6_DESHA|nr:hypothetical protein HMPREF0322_00219 [Desulfitobacterium hafniense DP7]